jgi:hypothetical protein
MELYGIFSMTMHVSPRQTADKEENIAANKMREQRRRNNKRKGISNER